MSNYPKWEDFLSAKITDWHDTNMGDLFVHRQEKNRPELPLLSVTGEGGVVDRDTIERRDTSNADKSKYLCVHKGDIVYNTMRMWQGVSGAASKDGLVSPAYTVLEPRESITSDFAKYLVKEKRLVQMFHKNSQGLVDDTLNLKFANLSSIKIKIPPLPEQKKIASILTSVDEVIETTKKQIYKLQDLKKATMNELLTRGVGHTEFKDSELGRIPKSWEIIRLLDIGQCVRGLTYAPENIVENGLLVLRSSNVQDGRLSFNDNVFVNLKVDDHYLSQDGDILICVRNGSRNLLGKSALIIGNRPKSTHGAFMTVFRTENYKFVRFLIQSDWFFTQVSRDIGATINSINNNNLLEYRFVFPPLDEQSKISSIMNSIEKQIDNQKNKLSQTQSLKESLMQDLLTGKVRVQVN